MNIYWVLEAIVIMIANENRRREVGMRPKTSGGNK